jgi:hypothetical protein
MLPPCPLPSREPKHRVVLRERVQLDPQTLGPEKQRLGWSWRDFRFTLLDHAYGEWMDLLVERLALERVR